LRETLEANTKSERSVQKNKKEEEHVQRTRGHAKKLTKSTSDGKKYEEDRKRKISEEPKKGKRKAERREGARRLWHLTARQQPRPRSYQKEGTEKMTGGDLRWRRTRVEREREKGGIEGLREWQKGEERFFWVRVASWERPWTSIWNLAAEGEVGSELAHGSFIAERTADINLGDVDWLRRLGACRL
jgi:hypothetical protein